MTRTLREEMVRITKDEQERSDAAAAQREAKQIVHSAKMKNASAECQRLPKKRNPEKKIAQGGLPALGKDR